MKSLMKSIFCIKFIILKFYRKMDIKEAVILDKIMTQKNDDEVILD